MYLHFVEKVIYFGYKILQLFCYCYERLIIAILDSNLKLIASSILANSKKLFVKLLFTHAFDEQGQDVETLYKLEYAH